MVSLIPGLAGTLAGTPVNSTPDANALPATTSPAPANLPPPPSNVAVTPGLPAPNTAPQAGIPVAPVPQHAFAPDTGEAMLASNYGGSKMAGTQQALALLGASQPYRNQDS